MSDVKTTHPREGIPKSVPMGRTSDQNTVPDLSVTPAASLVTPRRQLINSYLALTKTKIPRGQEYIVVAYFLVESPGEVYGMWIGLGCYPTQEKAKSVVEFLIQTTGHKAIISAKTGHWWELTTNTQPDRVTYVPTNLDGKLIQQNHSDLEREGKQIEARRQYEDELLQEQQREKDPNTIDHYIHNWYVAVRNRATVEFHEQKLKEAQANYDARVTAIQDQYARQPDMEDRWLNEVKDRLSRRGEIKVYEALERGARDLKDTVFRNKVTRRTDSVPVVTIAPLVPGTITVASSNGTNVTMNSGVTDQKEIVEPKIPTSATELIQYFEKITEPELEPTVTDAIVPSTDIPLAPPMSKDDKDTEDGTTKPDDVIKGSDGNNSSTSKSKSKKNKK